MRPNIAWGLMSVGHGRIDGPTMGRGGDRTVIWARRVTEMTKTMSRRVAIVGQVMATATGPPRTAIGRTAAPRRSIGTMNGARKVVVTGGPHVEMPAAAAAVAEAGREGPSGTLGAGAVWATGAIGTMIRAVPKNQTATRGEVARGRGAGRRRRRAYRWATYPDTSLTGRRDGIAVLRATLLVGRKT